MDHHQSLNCFVSFAVLIFGLFFFFNQLGPGKAFEHRCLRWAFGLWVLNWLIFALLYLMLAFSKLHVGGMIAMSSVGSLSWIAFFVVYVLGDDLAPKLSKSDPNDVSPGKRDRSSILRLIIVLSVVLGVAVIFAIVGDLLDFKNQGCLRSLSLIAIPQLLALVAALLMGWAFLVRYGPSVTALMLFAAACFYALAQSPAYLAVLGLGSCRVQDATLKFGNLFYFLGAMKLILALLCFALFASPFWEAGTTWIPRAELWPSVSAKPIDTRISKSFLYAARTVAGASLLYIVGRLLGLLPF